MNLVVEHDMIAGKWTPIGPPVADVGAEVLRTGSLSSTDVDGTTTLYVFGWRDGEGPMLWRVRDPAAQLEFYDNRERPRRAVIGAAGLEPLLQLSVKEPTELRLRQRGIWVNVRLRCVP